MVASTFQIYRSLFCLAKPFPSPLHSFLIPSAMSIPLFSSNGLPETLLELTQLAKPTSYSDIAALGLVAIGSAGYLLRGIAWDKPDPYRHLYYERPQLKDGAGSNAQKETRNIAQKLEESVSLLSQLSYASFLICPGKITCRLLGLAIRHC